MCRQQSCCPGPSGSGLGPLAVVAGLVLAAAAAGPVTAAAASLLHALVLILTITAATLAGITVLAVTVVITRRARRASGPHPAAIVPARIPRAHQLIIVGLRHHALRENTEGTEGWEAGRLMGPVVARGRPLPPSDQMPGADPGQAAQITAARRARLIRADTPRGGAR